MNDATTERRQFQRIAFDATTKLWQGQRQWSVELLDVSLKGLLVKTSQPWDGDHQEPLRAIIELSPDARVDMEVRLRRMQDTQLALSCEHIDIDSLSHLRRLLELNLGDSSLFEREVGALSA